MNILRFPLGQLQANCYFLVQDGDCVIIDPADSAEFILEEIARRNLTVRAVLATHGHFDHVMAAGELQLSLSRLYGETVPFYIGEEDLFLLERLESTAKHFLKYNPHTFPLQKISYVTSGNLELGNYTLKVLRTPGHTPGSTCYYLPDENIVFTGDTLFLGAVGDYSHKYSDKKLLMNSVRSLLELPEVTTIYPGHGDETLVQLERMNQPSF